MDGVFCQNRKAPFVPWFRIHPQCWQLKDSYVKKYTLEYFLQKISELTPNINSKFRKNYRIFPKSLAKTKSYYNETKSLKSFEIKEFSFLYILLVKPKLVRENFHLLDKY